MNNIPSLCVRLEGRCRMMGILEGHFYSLDDWVICACLIRSLVRMTPNFFWRFVGCDHMNTSLLISWSFVSTNFQFTCHILVQWSFIKDITYFSLWIKLLFLKGSKLHLLLPYQPSFFYDIELPGIQHNWIVFPFPLPHCNNFFTCIFISLVLYAFLILLILLREYEKILIGLVLIITIIFI